MSLCHLRQKYRKEKKRLFSFLCFLLPVSYFLFFNEVLAHRELRLVSEFGGKGEVEGKFGESTRFTFDKEGNIYVVDTDDRSIQKLDPSGKSLLKIQASEEDSNYSLVKPFDIAVSQKGDILVADWKISYIAGSKDPKIYNFGACVYKFSSEGKFIASFSIDDLTQKLKRKDEASAGIDEDGNFALIISVGKLYRPIYIAVDFQDHIYLLDQDRIYKLDSKGRFVKTFAQHGGGNGQLDEASDIEAGSEGDVYIADKGNHRVVKFNSEGEFVKDFGKRGEEDGEFISPYLIAVSSESNSIWVADQARYRKFFDLPLPIRENDPSADKVFPIGDEKLEAPEGIVSPLSPYRKDRIVIRRIQKFSLSDARFEDKQLIRIDINDPKMRNLNVKAIDSKGNVYLVDKKKQTYKKYSSTSSITLPRLRKLITLRYEIDRFQLDLDNPDDLDNVSWEDYTKWVDYVQKVRGHSGFVRFELSHDLSEDLSLSVNNWAAYFKSDITSLYPGEQKDYRGFPQDDISLDKYWADFISFEADLVLDQSVYKYREAGFFIYFGRARYDFTVDAISLQNMRFLKMQLWANQWGGGMRYDMGRSLRFIFEVEHGPSAGFFNYDYTYNDETGILYATGFRQGKATSIILAVDAIF